MKRIGILGGMGPESTIVFYQSLIKNYISKQNNYAFPEIVIFSVTLERILELQKKITRDKDKIAKTTYIAELLKGIHSLEGAKVDFIVLATNTPHMVFKKLQLHTKVPLLSIVEHTAQKAQELMLTNILLIGTLSTMRAHFYQDVFKKKSMKITVPQKDEQEELHTILIDELVKGIISQKSKNRVLAIINNYPVDTVILGSTEFSLLINQQDTPKILFDTLDIHAKKTLEYALTPSE